MKLILFQVNLKTFSPSFAKSLHSMFVICFLICFLMQIEAICSKNENTLRIYSIYIKSFTNARMDNLFYKCTVNLFDDIYDSVAFALK